MTTELASIDAPDDLRKQASECVLWSKERSITCADDLIEVGNHLIQIKTAQKIAGEYFDPPIKRADELHKMLIQRKRLITDPLSQSEKLDKENMLEFQRAEDRKAEVERQRLQAIADEKARKEREKIEQEAQKQRQIELEARQKAEAARRAAEEADEADRKKLLAEAQKNERAAAAAAAKVDTKMGEAAAVVSAPVIHVTSASPAVKGVTTVRRWKGEIVDLPALLDFICKTNRHDLIIVNEKMIEAYARSMTKNATMPGVRFTEVSSLSSRGS